jgi:hypothetical protein
MKNFNLIAKFPEVLGAALSDTSGALIDSVGQMDGEVAGAIHSYIVRSLVQAGEALGLGSFERGTMAAPAGTCLIYLQEGAVLGVNVSPNKPANVIEKKISDTLSK